MKTYKTLLIMNIFLQSCQSFKSDLKSNWKVLQEADSTSCEKWPRRSQDLEIYKMTPVIIDRPGFIVQSKTRSGLLEAYFAPFAGDNINLKKHFNLRWGVHSRFLGHFKYEGKDHIVLEVEDKKGVKSIEVRDPKSNVVKYSSSTNLRKFYGTGIFSSPHGFWITYKIHEPSLSLDEVDNFVMEAQLGEKSTMKLVKQSKFHPKGEIKAVEMMDRKLMVFVFEPDKNKNGAGRIMYTILDGSNNKPLIYTVGKEVLERVESWAISRHRDGALLVFISGDTLIWENAKLEIYNMDSLGDVLWTKSFPIEHEHVGDPLLVGSTLESYLILPKWLDSESTLEVQKITASEVKPLGYHGIFKEGTYTSGTYLDLEKNSLFVINQFPDGFIKSQAICEIDL